MAACRVEGYLWSWEVAMAGNWRQVAHFEEWLCALLAPLLLLLSGGGEAEKALIISIDCASSRPRDTAASGQHRPRGCPPIILKTHRQLQKSPLTHRLPITQTLIAGEERGDLPDDLCIHKIAPLLAILALLDLLLLAD